MLDTHEGRVDHLVRLQLGARLEHQRLAARLGHELDPHLGSIGSR